VDNLAEIKQRVNLCALAEALGLRRDRTSKRFWCPFGQHSRPNLDIKPQFFKCYACDAMGDAFDLVRRLKGCSFREALAVVSEFAGIRPPGPGTSWRRAGPSLARPLQPHPAQTDNGRPMISFERRVKILSYLCRGRRLRESDPPDEPARRYLRKRGISAATGVAAGLGFVWNYEATGRKLREALPLDELRACGLFNAKGNFVLWKHRLLLPFWLNGECLGLAARNISWQGPGDGGKELTISNPVVPFNADVLLAPTAEVYICEGVIDCLSLMELGFPAVGVPGAGRFRPEWVPLFDEAKEIFVVFDNDSAGRQGTDRIAREFAKVGRRVKAVQFPCGVKDANEFLTSEQIGG
jgi:DNA primase